MQQPLQPQGRRRIPLAEVTLPHECPQPVRMNALNRSVYFHDLGTAALERIDARMRTSTWHPDQAIYHAGEEADTLYIVAEGRVRLTRTTASGTQTVTDILGPGETFGAMGTLGEPYHQQTASALVGTCTLRLGQEAFRQVMAEHPTVGLRVVDDLAERLRRAEQDVGAHAAGTVEQRLAMVLLRLADKLGEDRGEQGVMLEVPLSRADLAGLAGSTPESVSRVMSRWKQEGLIDSGRRWTALRDRERLEDIAADAE